MWVSREQDLWNQDSHATVQHAADKFLLTVWRNTVAAAYAYPGDLLVGQNNLVEVSHHPCSLWAHELLSQELTCPYWKSDSLKINVFRNVDSDLACVGHRSPISLHAMRRLSDGISQPRSASPSGNDVSAVRRAKTNGFLLQAPNHLPLCVGDLAVMKIQHDLTTGAATVEKRQSATQQVCKSCCA